MLVGFGGSDRFDTLGVRGRKVAERGEQQVRLDQEHSKFMAGTAWLNRSPFYV